MSPNRIDHASLRPLSIRSLLPLFALAGLGACGTPDVTHMDASADTVRGGDADARDGGPLDDSSTPGDDGSGTADGYPGPPRGPYDTSIGDGVDANGYANLPLQSGAHRYFVNSSTGSDTNGCTAAQQPSTPMRSIATATACVVVGQGDQVMVAEGTTYSEGLPNLDARGGNSPRYPTVLQSYDPTDPLNEARYGRATSGHRPVVNTGANDQPITCCSNTPASYLAIRGFDIDPGNRPDMNLTIVGSNGMPNNYILIENNLFRYTQLVLNQPDAVHHVVRMNSFFGEWSPVGHSQGVFNAGTDGLTVEDNIFWHVGWKVGASRDDDPSVGGTTIFRHSVYQQLTSNAIVRRNVFIDPSATGCSCRGNTSIQENVFIENPISIIAGLGDNYPTIRPDGVTIDVGYNAILGDADINTALPRGGGITTGNGRPDTIVHHNVIARSRNPDAAIAFSTNAVPERPSYATYDNNLVYRWSTQTFGSTDNAFATYTNNIWDAPAMGTNRNVASETFPNPYTEAELFTRLGCTDKATCVAAMITSPELGWAPRARAILWAGYGR